MEDFFTSLDTDMLLFADEGPETDKGRKSTESFSYVNFLLNWPAIHAELLDMIMNNPVKYKDSNCTTSKSCNK